MVYRDRKEKLAHLKAMGAMFTFQHNMSSEKIFAGVYREYEEELFQEDYNSELLRRKARALKQAQAIIGKRKQSNTKLLDKLERMGQFYDAEYEGLLKKDK